MDIREYIDKIQTLYSKGIKSFSTRLSNRHIYSTIASIRKTLISQKSKKKQYVSSWSYQTFCIDMEYNAKCNASITKYPLPKTLTDYNGDLIKSVRTIDGSENIDKIEPEQVKYLKGNRYTSKKLRYYIQDGYLYLNRNIGPKQIEVTILADNPLDVYYLNQCCSKEEDFNCISPLDMEFPIDGDLEETLVQLASQRLVQEFQILGRQDLYNNLREDTQTVVQAMNNNE